MVITFIVIIYPFSIDATEIEGLGKMVNDSPEIYANAKMKRMIIGKDFHLCLFSTASIEKGTEIRWNFCHIFKLLTLDY